MIAGVVVILGFQKALHSYYLNGQYFAVWHAQPPKFADALDLLVSKPEPEDAGRFCDLLKARLRAGAIRRYRGRVRSP